MISIEDMGPNAPNDYLTQMFDILRNERRRYALRHLLDAGETSIGEVAEHIAAAETDKSTDNISSGERKARYVTLYQCHLPKLSMAGVVDYDERAGTVGPTPMAHILSPHVD